MKGLIYSEPADRWRLVRDRKGTSLVLTQTPLHTAARCGHLAVFKFIFETIKYKEPKTSDGRTPLKVAIQFEHYDICQFIKDSRSSKDSVNHL